MKTRLLVVLSNFCFSKIFMQDGCTYHAAAGRRKRRNSSDRLGSLSDDGDTVHLQYAETMRDEMLRQSKVVALR